MSPATDKSAKAKKDLSSSLKEIPSVNKTSKPDHLKLSPRERADLAAKRAREKIQSAEQTQASNMRMGSLSSTSVFGDDFLQPGGEEKTIAKQAETSNLAERNYANMSRVLNPRPNARARWQRKMVIRNTRRSGRLTKEMIISRTERQALSRSHFFKTSMKKLAPLARQIAGKGIDEAILQMRFSKKKAAQDVLGHLIQAKNEAIAVKGMGINSISATPAPDSPIVTDPSIQPALPMQRTNKAPLDGVKGDTDIYVSQAWINRGPYGKELEPRARGRANILRPPHTGLSVLLKEEKTRTREKAEKDEKAIRKRMGKNMWTQLPDRPIVNQSQYVLW